MRGDASQLVKQETIAEPVFQAEGTTREGWRKDVNEAENDSPSPPGSGREC